MKLHVLAASALVLIGASSSLSAQAQAVVQPLAIQATEIIRGALPFDHRSPPTQVKAAVCPTSYFGRVNNGRYVCERTIAWHSPIKCPAPWPRLAITNGRDICFRDGVPTVLTPDQFARLRPGIDYVQVPTNGTFSGKSFVAYDSTVTPSDGWRLNTNGSVGADDRYTRLITLHASPILVPLQ
jgi:hypothetical protein